MVIREAENEDFERLWPLFQEIIEEGYSLPYSRKMKQDDAFFLWMEVPKKTYVVEQDGELVGSYYIKTNELGGGDHVCSCRYFVGRDFRQQGIGFAMVQHSERLALQLGYLAIVCHSVVGGDAKAIGMLNKAGFSLVGKLEKGFRHPKRGYINALTYYKWLDR